MVNRDRVAEEDEPLFVMGIAAKMVGMHAQSLCHYERLGPVRRAELQHYRDRMLPTVKMGEKERE